MLKNKDAMKGEMDRRIIYGSEEFIEKTKGKYEIEEIIKPKGRPKKDGEGNK